MKKTSAIFSSLAVILTVMLSACGASATPVTPTVDVGVFYTQAAATIMVGLTQTSEAQPSATPLPPSPSPQPSATPAPTETAVAAESATQPAAQLPSGPSATPVPVDPATAHGCYNATLVADVTILYAPAFKPGDKFTKTWRIKNTGSCDWPRGFKIAFVSGDRFGTDTMDLSQKVSAGATTEISLAMTAPNLTGVVNSNWQLSTDIGKSFGPVLGVAITLPGVTAISGGCLNSALVTDVTAPSGSEFNTGESFTKTWRVQNTGSCTWNRDFKITFVGGDLLGSDTTKIRQIVGPGSTTEISLSMTAPGSTGTVSSSWQMASDDGTLFGQQFTFSIVVK